MYMYEVFSDTWMKETFIDSLDCPGLCEDPYHIIREELRSALAPLSEVCTHRLLHHARVEKYGKTYTDAQPRNKIESLLVLDRMSHVPHDTPATADFASHVRAFAEAVGRRVWTSLAPDGSARCHIADIGSFPCDTKVGDIDEFDYLVVADIRQTVLVRRENGHWVAKAILPGYRHVTPDFHSRCRDVVDCLIPIVQDGSGNGGDPHVSDFYKHGPATCIEVSWSCPEQHTHTVGIDLTLAFEVQVHDDTSGGYRWDPPLECKYDDPMFGGPTKTIADVYAGLDSLPVPFGNTKHKRDSLLFAYTGKATRYNFRLSSTPYDQHMFDALEENLSPKIKAIFRILKVLTREVLPVRVDATAQSDTEAASSLHGFYTSSVLDSHALKCLLFQEVDTHSARRHWRQQCLLKRITGVLELLCVSEKEDRRGEMDPRWPNFKDYVTHTMGSFGRGGPLPEYKGPADICRDLITYLNEPPNSTVYHAGRAPGTGEAVYLKGWEGKYNRCRLVKEVALTHFNFIKPCTVAYVFTERGGPRRTHPVLRWCGRYARELCARNEGADLSGIAPEDLRYVWGLMFGNALTNNDVSTGRYVDKVKKAKHMLGFPNHHNHDGLWELYLTNKVKYDFTPRSNVWWFFAAKGARDLREPVLNLGEKLQELFKEYNKVFDPLDRMPELEHFIMFYAMEYILSDSVTLADFI